eukprot:219140-Pelagomonas_calceolata.AAC.3
MEPASNLVIPAADMERGLADGHLYPICIAAPRHVPNKAAAHLCSSCKDDDCMQAMSKVKQATHMPPAAIFSKNHRLAVVWAQSWDGQWTSGPVLNDTQKLWPQHHIWHKQTHLLKVKGAQEVVDLARAWEPECAVMTNFQSESWHGFP